MDRQQLERREIPVNARAVGSPMGMNVLYLEDYVHTFIKKLIKNAEEDDGCEVFLYGYEFDEEGKHFLIVSGGYQHESRYDRPDKIGAQYFPESTYLGVASIHSDGVSEMNMEIIREGTRSIVLKNFYIYYDQNEEMQNYLIEWNLEHRGYRNRNEMEDTVRYGRIAQAQNKEEVRVSFLWNAMNILSLGFIVCIMVYGILGINNYHKMKDMEDKLSYIVTTMTENQDFLEVSSLLPAQTQGQTVEETEVFQTQIVEAVTTEESIVTEEAAIGESVIEMAEIKATEQPTEETAALQNTTEASAAGEITTPNMTEVSQEEKDSTVLAEATSIPQYYVVQQGDTLRSICINVYGNLDNVDEICEQNGITNPDSILYGQTLLLP